MKERSEADIISRAPVTVKLGEHEYPIRPLPINKARAWREKLVEVMKSIVADMGATAEPENMGPAMTASLIAFPEKVSDLVFAWAPELNKELILEEATEEQMAAAFTVIMVFAYPMLAPLVLALRVSKSQLAKK